MEMEIFKKSCIKRKLYRWPNGASGGSSMISRRQLLITLGAGSLATAFASLAQPQGKVWRVGYLATRARPISLDTDYAGVFLRGMRELGYIEGKNLIVEWRFAEGRTELLPVLAAELVRLQVDVIVTSGAAAAIAAQKATATIPIVFPNTGDPVGAGFVKSLARPGGNMTGLSNISGDIVAKHLEMLHSMVPKLSRVAVLWNPSNKFNISNLERVQSAAQRTSVKILPVEARTEPEIDKAFSAMAQDKAGAVIVINDTFFIQQQRQIAELAAKHRLPSIAAIREYAEAGGLMSYGSNRADNIRRVATYVDKIFKGAKPADLPVEQPTKFELVINGKTAKALGLKIPQSLLTSADKVIE
jgi:putative ABC transport system substrate-binding protein